MRKVVLYNLVYKWKSKPYAYQVYANRTLVQISEFLKLNKEYILWFRTYSNKVVEVE